MAIFPASAIPAGATGFDIDNSLRFNDDDSAYLSRTHTSGGNRKTWTWSGWAKKTETGNARNSLFGCHSSGSDVASLRWQDDHIEWFDYNSGYRVQITTAVEHRDPSAWYHIVIALDTTQATSSDRAKLYINGVQLTDLGATAYPSLNADLKINTTLSHWIGGSAQYSDRYMDGYLAEVHFIDGTALDPTSFGETGTYGEWKPKEVTGLTYGTNGFYLDFKVAGTGTTGAGKDVSGKGNHWATSGIASTDQMVDTPTNNFCTLNPLANNHSDGLTLSEGNLKHYLNRSSYTSTFAVTTGKWYWEFNTVVANAFLGLFTDPTIRANQNVNTIFDLFSNGTVTTQGATLASDTLSSISAGDIIGFALDATNGTCDVYQNNSKVIEITSIPTTDSIFFFSDRYSASGLGYPVINFGQDSSFAGNDTTTAGPYTDGGGVGDFFYEPPSGFLALCTKNLPDVATGLWADGNNQSFNTITWTADSTSGSRAFTGVNFSPDFVWVKSRSGGWAHHLYDTVRGSGSAKMLSSTNTDAEGASSSSSYGYLSSFDSDGFTFTDGTNGTYPDGQFNYQTDPAYVAWNWKAGGAASTISAGAYSTSPNVPSIASSVSANADAGFSIVSYTGNSTAGATIGHGLSSTPEMVIVKERQNNTGSVIPGWYVYHEDSTSSPQTNILRLDLTDANNNIGSTYWNSTAPTNSVFTVGGSDHINGSTDPYIAYCFHSVDGYSKVGSYTGNFSTDGTFVYTGFRPAYVMVKDVTNGQSWWVFDNARDVDNAVGKRLRPDSSTAEYTGDKLDFVSNGFKWRDGDNAWNYTGDTYIFIAFAEVPFKFSNAR
jgi:hypothetical protein